ncbi:MAG: hypothetical protein K2Y27_23125 [Xanthobacteraceae bacterium]|nr:hypothetical protein [Xanthobacteraceae bacterium]
MLRFVTICTALLLFNIAVSGAQESFDQKYGGMVSDDTAREAIRLALSKIHTGTCEADKPCAPATASEIANPPIAVVDGRAAMVFAIKSALAQWCGIDWKRSLLPMIAFGKRQMKMNDRQLQLMTLIHGDFQGRQFVFYSKSGQCPSALRDQLDAQLPKLQSGLYAR